MSEKADLAEAESLTNGLDILDHVRDGVLLRIFQSGGAAGAALVDEDQATSAHERQQVRKKVVVGSAGTAMQDHQRRAVSDGFVVDQHAMAIDGAFLHRVNSGGRAVECGKCET